MVSELSQWRPFQCRWLFWWLLASYGSSCVSMQVHAANRRFARPFAARYIPRLNPAIDFDRATSG